MKTKKYELKEPVLAVQWFKNGDHPNDRCTTNENGAYNEGEIVRYFRSPIVAGKTFCKCGDTNHYHGWIDQGDEGLKVCPSDYVIEKDVGVFEVMNQVAFRLTYKVAE
jgi:hypothetical protein